MLLLTSVILLIGFIALSSMVIRVTQLPEETAQDSRKPIDLEADAVAEGVRHLLLRTHERVPITNLLGYIAYSAAVEDSLDTLVDLEKGRGFRFEWDPVQCTQPGAADDVDISVTVTLQDLDTRVRITVTQGFSSTVLPLVCTP